ncbi:MAG TPA: XdhC family protein [Ktedonobacteraceae bacterium]|jgi:xanthine dehydrogenase accessory factor|nr:XdhC family protein [Ktedonobacteraceae bacterium]
MPDIRTLLELAYQLTQAGKSFVVATVVWCERPTSAKPGARAIIEADGQITGWVGGSCTQPVVVREAMRALREGDDPYLLHLGTPDTGGIQRDVRVFPMTCVSGGALEVYMEPHLPQPLLVLIGDSPVVAALGQLAPVLDFAVTHLNHADVSQVQIDQRTAIVVATHGQYDEDVLEQALRSPAAYVGMVGSHRRANTCRTYLRTSGLEERQIARLKAPAGLAIGAITPEEIASSILAELVQVRRQSVAMEETEPSSTPEEQQHLSPVVHDPVCGMLVEIANARHHMIYEGRDYYFCCPACQRSFERNPQEYLVQNEK